jgi:HAD superfamily hydrolase (TIGR01509 family)
VRREGARPREPAATGCRVRVIRVIACDTANCSRESQTRLACGLRRRIQLQAGAGFALVRAFMKLDIPQGDFAGFLFDLDGTLVDTMPLHFVAWRKALWQCGLGRDLDEDFFYSLGGVPTLLVAQRIGEHYGVKLDPAQVEQVKEKSYLGLLRDAKLILPVVEFARRAAKTHPVAIVTGGMPEVAQATLESAGLSELFPIVVTPADVPPGRGKPAPDMFLLGARRMGVAVERCLVFEDAEPGIAGARAAGMQVVRVASRDLVGSR